MRRRETVQAGRRKRLIIVAPDCQIRDRAVGLSSLVANNVIMLAQVIIAADF